MYQPEVLLLHGADATSRREDACACLCTKDALRSRARTNLWVQSGGTHYWNAFPRHHIWHVYDSKLAIGKALSLCCRCRYLASATACVFHVTCILYVVFAGHSQKDFAQTWTHGWLHVSSAHLACLLQDQDILFQRLRKIRNNLVPVYPSPSDWPSEQPDASNHEQSGANRDEDAVMSALSWPASTYFLHGQSHSGWLLASVPNLFLCVLYSHTIPGICRRLSDHRAISLLWLLDYIVSSLPYSTQQQCTPINLLLANMPVGLHKIFCGHSQTQSLHADPSHLCRVWHPV